VKRGNQQEILAKSELHYDETHCQVMSYFTNSATDVREGKAHVEFHERGACTRTTIRARLPGEPCPDQEEGATWFHALAQSLERRQSCGKLGIVPRSDTMDITVET
jgi:hypothetical protein